MDIKDAPWGECECGNKMFEGSILVKRVSQFLSPSGKEEIMPIEVMYCTGCKKIPGFINTKIPNIPEELKAILPVTE